MPGVSPVQDSEWVMDRLTEMVRAKYKVANLPWDREFKDIQGQLEGLAKHLGDRYGRLGTRTRPTRASELRLASRPCCRAPLEAHQQAPGRGARFRRPLAREGFPFTTANASMN